MAGQLGVQTEPNVVLAFLVKSLPTVPVVLAIVTTITVELIMIIWLNRLRQYLAVIIRSHFGFNRQELVFLLPNFMLKSWAEEFVARSSQIFRI